MSLVAAKCTQCGADIKVDNEKDAGICEHCGTAFIVEKAINNYNTYVVNNHNYAGATINNPDVDKIALDKLFRNGKTFLELKDFRSAYEVYTKIIKEYPDRYEGYKFLIIAGTSDFNEQDDKYPRRANCEEYLKDLKEKMIRVASESEKEDCILVGQKLDIYIDRKKEFIHRKEIENEILNLQNQISEVQKNLESSSLEIAKYQRKVNKYNRNIVLVIAVAVIIIMLTWNEGAGLLIAVGTVMASVTAIIVNAEERGKNVEYLKRSNDEYSRVKNFLTRRENEMVTLKAKTFRVN